MFVRTVPVPYLFIVTMSCSFKFWPLARATVNFLCSGILFQVTIVLAECLWYHDVWLLSFCMGIYEYLFLFIYVLYSTLFHMPTLRFHCVGGCWDRTENCCDFLHWQSGALTTRLDLIQISARSHTTVSARSHPHCIFGCSQIWRWTW